MKQQKIPAALPNCPDRHIMVRAAIYMERNGFSHHEYSIVARLCDSSAAIRSYILKYAEEVLDMWDGLVPHNATFSYEIALIAAHHAYLAARRECSPLEGRVDYLLKAPEAWTKEQYAAAHEAYTQRHFSRNNSRVTAALEASLERETCAIYGAPYETESGCVVIPFPTIEAEKRTWEN